MEQAFDVIVVGGGPSGATAADDLARLGRKVALLDRAGRIKPCGGAIPPRLMRDPRKYAPWYNATGTSLFVFGMLASAIAVRTLVAG